MTAKPVVTIRRSERDYFGPKWAAKTSAELAETLNDAVAEEIRRLIEDGYFSIDAPRPPHDNYSPEEWSICFSCGYENAPIAWWSLREVLKNLDVEEAPAAARADLRAMLVNAIAAIDGAPPFEERDF